MNLEDAKKLLLASDLLFDADDFEEDPEMWDKLVLNMNDVWGWACADCEEIPEKDIQEVARLFTSYGWCGVLYWVSEKNGGMRSEFLDNNRFIDFVRNEEKLRKKIPGSSTRAYKKIRYTLGANRTKNTVESFSRWLYSWVHGWYK